MRVRSTAAVVAAWVLTLVGGPARAADPALESRKVLTLQGATQLGQIAMSEALKRSAGGSIAVVDDGGALLYLIRLDNTFPASATVAAGKARTAAQFRKPTNVFETAIKNGRNSLTAVMEMVPLEGGVPITIDGHVVGAIGVSGAMTADQDEEIAQAAAAAFMNRSATAGR